MYLNIYLIAKIYLIFHKRGSEDYETDMRSWISKLDSLVIGPGLGRSDDAFKYFKDAISIAKPLKIPIVIDADGLFFVSK